ncbi:hypothetical protein K474DRAFT_1690438 [Panus rudis PR-1116 ss-1]|nr:hypothetical protein K474DRAFT_1690438 [Panus rudis PR-1116 ss-1]
MAASRDKKPYSRPPSRPRGSDGSWLHDRAPGATSHGSNSNARSNASPSTKLQISNLHYEITPKDLTQIFGTKGTLVREPLIRYDRSGRSSGVAIVSYETVAEATAAKREYDGRLCKDQPMSIEFYHPPTKPSARRSVSAPSLINRIQKPALLDRLGGEKPQARGPAQQGTGPIRNKKPPRAPNAPRGPKKPKTAEELDKELDAFMHVDASPAAAAPASQTNGAASAATTAPAEPAGDVEMAA